MTYENWPASAVGAGFSRPAPAKAGPYILRQAVPDRRYSPQKLNRTPSSTMRGAWAVVDWPKNGEVITPLGLLKFR
jgi:hypothetical protein